MSTRFRKLIRWVNHIEVMAYRNPWHVIIDYRQPLRIEVMLSSCLSRQAADLVSNMHPFQWSCNGWCVWAVRIDALDILGLQYQQSNCTLSPHWKIGCFHRFFHRCSSLRDSDSLFRRLFTGEKSEDRRYTQRCLYGECCTEHCRNRR